MTRKRDATKFNHVPSVAAPEDGGHIPVVTAAQLRSDPAYLWKHHIRTRTPAIIELGTALGGAALAPERWSLAALSRDAGDAVCHIEQRDPHTRTFGTGRKTPMRFRDFVAALKAGREDLYMTTQPLPEDEDGLNTALMGEPLTCMYKRSPGRVPLTLPACGELVPSTINLWIGAARSGSSSNLHHDFHDNLYVLLSGVKVFTITHPRNAAAMYTHGRVERVHDNGLINYRGIATRSDGVPLDWIDPRTGWVRVGAHTHTYTHTHTHTHTHAHSHTHSRAHGASAGVKRARSSTSHDESSPRRTPAVEPSEADAMWAALEAEATRGCKRAREQGGAHTQAQLAETTMRMPNHFSRVRLPELRAALLESRPGLSASDLALFRAVQSHCTIARSFPKFKDVPLTVFRLEAGQALYLPAGWFHEVVSFNTSASATDGAVHIALNYWYHPPDFSGDGGPYPDTFWKSVHEGIMAGM